MKEKSAVLKDCFSHALWSAIHIFFTSGGYSYHKERRKDMKVREGTTAYERYRDAQVAWASAEDLLVIMAQELIRLKDESGMNLFWDESEEKFLRDYLENEAKTSQN